VLTRYLAVECAGCNRTVNRFELASHQINCEGIAAAVKDDEGDSTSQKLSSLRITTSITSAEVADLLSRISTLEFQLKTVKRDMQISESKNRVLEREYRKTKEELEQKRNELMDLQCSEFDSGYEYGFTPQSVAKLSLLMAKFLLKKPSHINRDKLFSATRRCYEQFSRCGHDYEHDVHMLVATAFASNWFSESQRLTLHCWLQSIARHRQLKTSSGNFSSSCTNSHHSVSQLNSAANNIHYT
jgi:hypothetical protein